MIRVQDSKFFLPPGFHLQGSSGMYLDLLFQERLVQTVYVVRPDIHLSVIFQGVQLPELKKMNLDAIFFNHQIVGVVYIAPQLKAQFVDVIGPGGGFVAHGQFGVNFGKHEIFRWVILIAIGSIPLVAFFSMEY